MKKKKKEEFYYKNLNTCVELSCQAAEFLKEIVSSYQKESLKEKVDAMHELEQKADSKKHKMTEALSSAFITPIEREDLIALSSYIDDITDAVEEVLLQIYMCRIDTIRKDVIPTLNLLTECLQALKEVIAQLKDFKHSKKITASIIKVNDLEEQADKMYMENMYALHKEQDLRTIMMWRTIYEYLENCFDTCEHAADIVETVMMKNS
ncbi:MAG: DUF47 family protein [Lachnospiraceae bacterium]|nr:DUF47 family protein [Lachnospiraceae bacterium]